MRTRQIPRIPATSTSSTPIRNTTAASTALGMYWSGSVRNSSTTSTTAAVVSCDTWLRPPALSTIWVLVGLPLTTKVPVRPAASVGGTEADQVDVLGERLLVLAA